MAGGELTALIEQLVRIDSVNPSLIEGAAGEREIARFVAGWASDRGLEVELVGGGERPSVIVTARGSVTANGFGFLPRRR